MISRCILFTYLFVGGLPLFAQPIIDPANLDLSVKPEVDFYQYANGTWLSNHPVPAEFSAWGTIMELREDSLKQVREIVEMAAADRGAAPGSVSQQIGDLYASGMDVDAIEKAGLSPLQPLLERVSELKEAGGLPQLLASLHDSGVSACFGFGVGIDAKDSKTMVCEFVAGGLSLPDRDYYLKTDEASQKIREKYQAHVGRIFQLAGDSEELAKQQAGVVLEIEKQLAEASMTRVERRDADKTYHKMLLPEFGKMLPGFSTEVYIASRRAGKKAEGDVCVSEPEFFRKFNEMLSIVPVKDWQVYLRWHVLHSFASELAQKFVDENFDFYGKTLTGAQENRPRWKQVLGTTQAVLGEPIGKIFVKKHFPAEAKQKVLDMVAATKATLRARIQKLDWMGPETKQAALNKLDKMKVKMGYPDKWEDFSELKIERSSYLQNCINASQFENRRDFEELGKPVDRDRWFMTPQTVNAYYSAEMNEIVFPAAILQPPYFDPKADDAVNFGGIGAVIGHEMTHGFDDQGRKFDAEGNLKSWWTDADLANYKARSQKVVALYNSFKVLGETKVNGELTQGENIADIGGMRIAWETLQEQWKKTGKPAPIDGFTGEQRFFLAWAQAWRQNIREETLRLRIATDPHSPGAQRVNGVCYNMPEFYEAFGCKAPKLAPVDIW